MTEGLRPELAGAEAGPLRGGERDVTLDDIAGLAGTRRRLGGCAYVTSCALRRGTPYAQFAEVDVEQVLALIDFLHGPAHSVQTGADRNALTLILRRVEGAIAVLLEADRLGSRDA